MKEGTDIPSRTADGNSKRVIMECVCVCVRVSSHVVVVVEFMSEKVRV